GNHQFARITDRHSARDDQWSEKSDFLFRSHKIRASVRLAAVWLGCCRCNCDGQRCSGRFGASLARERNRSCSGAGRERCQTNADPNWLIPRREARDVHTWSFGKANWDCPQRGGADAFRIDPGTKFTFRKISSREITIPNEGSSSDFSNPAASTKSQWSLG